MQAEWKKKVISKNDQVRLCVWVYLLLFKHIDVFEQAQLAEQLGQVICQVGAGAPLTAGRPPPLWAHTFEVAAAIARKALRWTPEAKV